METTTDIDYRGILHRLMRETLKAERDYHTWLYDAVRPMPVPARPYAMREHVKGDCGKGVQYLCWWARVHDPMGRGYDAYGNAETLCLHLQHVDLPADLKVGDVVCFGPRGEKHAAMVMEEGPDPLLWSFGVPGAPNTYRLSQDPREHHLRRNPLPRYVPTADDKLRALTGYWAWVQWKLGEGDWRHHKPADPSVRPNVPKVITPRWWTRYALFLANRSKGTSTGTRGMAFAGG